MKKRIISLLLIATLLCVGRISFADTSISDAVPRSSLEFIPLFNGEDYVPVHDNQPDFILSQLTTVPYIMFSTLDELGRTGPGMACLGPETLPTQPRGVIGNIQPSGWHTTRYDDLIEDKYLFNRSHVIGYMLCGDNSTPENIFTGTRYLNAGSMLLFEAQVADYIETTRNHVIFRCSPIYDGENLIASGVQMEAFSVEDNGQLQFNVFVFNIQPGIEIDYSTGDSKIVEPATEAVSDKNIAQREEVQETEKAEIAYVLNTNTHKFHKPNCSSVKDIKEKNRKDFFGTREEAIAAGYVPCKRCHP